MIQATVFEDSRRIYQGIRLTGHAGYGEYGQDIVCAAVSALTLNMANAVAQFTEDDFEGEIEEETGDFQFRFTSDPGEGSILLMKSLVLGLENIQKEYGKQYIKIRFEEV